MTSITRNAIKAIKLYKHVVQCVEKFIQKVNKIAYKSNFYKNYLKYLFSANPSIKYQVYM